MIPHIYQCTRPKWFDPNQFIILQRRPSSYQINKKWKSFCHHFCHPTTLKRTPEIQFGTWTASFYPRPRRQTYIETATDPPTIYHFHNQSYWNLSRHPTIADTYTLSDATEWTPTITSYPIAIRMITSTMFHYSNHSLHPIPPNPADPQHLPMPAPMIPPPIPADTHLLYNFSQLLPNLSPWQYRLLETIQFKYTLQHIHHTLQECATNNIPITMLSLASKHWSNTILGWALCLPNGTTLAISGIQFASTLSPHRSAAWANLSAALFLQQLYVLFHSNPLPNTTFHFLMTHKPVCHLLCTHAKHKVLFPNVTLEPDWDLIAHTHFILHNTLQVRPSYLTSYKKLISLSLDGPAPTAIPPKHLKHLRKTIANCARDSHAIPEIHLPLLPSTRCILELSSQPIHSDYVPAIREQAALPNLFGYLRDRLHWQPDTHTMIQWNWFKKAISLYKRSSHPHLVKLIHRKLATPAHQAKAGGHVWASPTCSHCTRHEPETFDHMLRCNRPEAIQFRQNLSTRLHKYFPAWVPLRFRTTFITRLHSWLDRTDLPNDPHDPPELIQLMEAQAQIGWHSLLRGYISSHWSSYLTFELAQQGSEQPTHEPNDELKLFSGLIYEIWAAQSDFWHLYQTNRHSPTPDSTPPPGSKRDELCQTISHLLSLQPQIEPTRTDIYYPPDLPTFLSDSTTAQLEAYIANYGDAIKRSIRRRKSQSIANTRSLLTFPGFQRQPTMLSNAAAPPLPPPPLPPPAPPPPPRPSSTRRITTWLTRQAPAATPPALTPPLPEHNPERIHGAPPHPKHTRWRPLDSTRRRFRNFFTNTSSSS